MENALIATPRPASAAPRPKSVMPSFGISTLINPKCLKVALRFFPTLFPFERTFIRTATDKMTADNASEISNNSSPGILLSPHIAAERIPIATAISRIAVAFNVFLRPFNTPPIRFRINAPLPTSSSAPPNKLEMEKISFVMIAPDKIPNIPPQFIVVIRLTSLVMSLPIQSTI